MMDTGYWILDGGYWILDTGYWILDAGWWMQFLNLKIIRKLQPPLTTNH